MIIRGLLLIALCLAPFVLSSYQVMVLNYIALYAIVALGLVLLTGIAGLMSIGQAAFVGIGAYATALICTAQWPLTEFWISLLPWLGLGLGLLITMVSAWVLGRVTLKLGGHFLPLGTIAWSLGLYYVFTSAPVFGGHTGVGDIPPAVILGHSFSSSSDMFWLIWAVLLAAIWATRNLLNSREGRAIRSLKSGETMAEAMGIDTSRSRMLAFIIAALLGCVAGWLYAHMQRFVNPSPFALNMSIEYLFIAVIGGAGYLWGAVAGAAVVVLLKQWLQDILPQAFGMSGNFEMMVFAVVMLVLLHRFPDGLWAFVAGRRVVRAVPDQNVLDVSPLRRRSKPKAGTPVLQVRNVTRRFGGLVANDDVSLVLHAGEILALVGPNGAGKSTLFNQISGVDVPDSGTVVFSGKDITGLGSRRVAQLGMSRSFQHVRLLPLLSCLDNVKIGAHLRGDRGPLRAIFRLNKQEEQQLHKEAMQRLQAVGLHEHAYANAGTLALGQQRMLEIARALASDPCVLLLDEPAAGLRRKEKQELATLLARLRSHGMAILLVEHDMDFVMQLADRMLVMNFGVTIAEGSPQCIRRHPAVLEAYLGGAAA